MKLHITCIPSDPHYKDFWNHTSLSGIRLNGLLFKACDLDNELSLLPKVRMGYPVPVWFDAKGRQLRVEESISHVDHLELVLNHRIDGLKLPHPILFKAGEDWAMVERITDDGRRLHCRPDGYPKYRVKPGDSIHFRDQNLTIKDNLFTDDEKSKIEKVVKLGFRKFYLSYVEKQEDLDEFRELVGKDSEIILKIESRKGLEYVSKNWGGRPYPGVQLAAARGDLYVEVDKPHQILDAQKLVISSDPNAIVGSRMLLSLFNNPVPACSDVCEIELLRMIGYRNFLLCDDLCKSGEALDRAIGTFDAIRSIRKFNMVSGI